MCEEASAIETGLPRMDCRCERVIGTDSAECCNTFGIAIFRSLQKVLKFSNLVAAIDRACYVVMFYQYTTLANRQVDDMFADRRRQRRDKAFSQPCSEFRVSIAKRICHYARD